LHYILKKALGLEVISPVVFFGHMEDVSVYIAMGRLSELVLLFYTCVLFSTWSFFFFGVTALRYSLATGVGSRHSQFCLLRLPPGWGGGAVY
jgi:hypothetical protein